MSLHSIFSLPIYFLRSLVKRIKIANHQGQLSPQCDPSYTRRPDSLAHRSIVQDNPLRPSQWHRRPICHSAPRRQQHTQHLIEWARSWVRRSAWAGKSSLRQCSLYDVCPHLPLFHRLCLSPTLRHPLVLPRKPFVRCTVSFIYNSPNAGHSRNDISHLIPQFRVRARLVHRTRHYDDHSAREKDDRV